MVFLDSASLVFHHHAASRRPHLFARHFNFLRIHQLAEPRREHIGLQVEASRNSSLPIPATSGL